MGLFDKFKDKAKEALDSATSAVQDAAGSASEAAAPAAAPASAPAPAAAAAPAAASGPTFTYDDDEYPQPPGWAGLSIEDWFFKLEMTRERMMHADEEDLEPMTDEDGDELDPEEIILIKEGFQSGGHWEAFRNWGVAGWAAETGENTTDVEFRMTGIAREKIMANKASAMGGDAGGAGGGTGQLEAVEGVSCDAWAAVNAKVAGGGDVAALAADAGMDKAKWDRVNAEWMNRMQTDTSGAIATVYGNAFAGASGGQFGGAAAHAASVGVGGDLGPEPISFEKFVEVQVAMGAASDRGEDATALLQSFGLSIVDWSNIGMYWSKKQSQEITKYHALYTEYQEKYEAKYSA